MRLELAHDETEQSWAHGGELVRGPEILSSAWHGWDSVGPSDADLLATFDEMLGAGLTKRLAQIERNASTPADPEAQLRALQT